MIETLGQIQYSVSAFVKVLGMTKLNPTSADGFGGWTPLRYAVVSGDPKLVQKLIDAGADIKCVLEKAYPQYGCSKGDTILHTAMIVSTAEVVGILLR